MAAVFTVQVQNITKMVQYWISLNLRSNEIMQTLFKFTAKWKYIQRFTS